MSSIKLFIGRIMSYLKECEIAYKEHINNNEVNNEGGRINGRCTVVFPKNITIGKNSYVNSGYLIASPNAKIIIGDDCLLSYNVHIRTDMHNYMDSTETINKQGHNEKNIIIKNDVWIGYGAQIMPGVVIEKGCVIGAGAIVTHNTEPYGVYVGIPAKLIKYRESK